MNFIFFHEFLRIFKNLYFLHNTGNTIRNKFREIREYVHEKMKKNIVYMLKRYNNKNT